MANPQLASGKRAKIVRLVVLSAVLVLTTALGLLHQYAAVKPAGVDAFCPFGGLESLVSVVMTGTVMKKIAWSSFVVLAAVLVAAVLFRRTFCGTLCPLGTLQELSGKLGRKLLGKRLDVPAKVDKPARWLKYVALAVFIALTWTLGELAMRPYDPWVAFNHLSSAELFTELWIGLVVLVVGLVGSFFVDRFFCKYLCPMGAFLGLLSKLGLFKVKRVAQACVNCGACDKACPANIAVSKGEVVTSAECIDCDACVNACPAAGALVIEGPGKKRITPIVRIVATVAIFALVVGVATLAGAFNWYQSDIAKTVAAKEAGQAVAPIDPEAIKGSTTWDQLVAATGIPKEAFMERFGIPADEFDKQIKEAAHAEGSTFAVDDVRAFVAERLKP